MDQQRCSLALLQTGRTERQMEPSAGASDSVKRHRFIGGSDARIIMGNDEAALVRLWREKRGEAKPSDYSANLVVQLGLATEHLNRRWYERTTGQLIKDIQSWVRHPVIRWMAATLDGVVESTGGSLKRNSCCPGHSPRRQRPKNICRGSAQHVGDQCHGGGALDHHGRRQMGGDQDKR
jgi:hypothetical protein